MPYSQNFINKDTEINLRKQKEIDYPLKLNKSEDCKLN